MIGQTKTLSAKTKIIQIEFKINFILISIEFRSGFEGIRGID